MPDENCPARANVDVSQLRRGKTIEQIYQKKTQLEHILLRPDTYVGSTEHQQQDMFVFDEFRGEMEYRKIDYVPALYKIFDEILVNAADNMMRDAKGMDLIDVTIDKQQGYVSVMNNGKGVPVQIHKEHKCYVPEMIFGQLLTSDNYDDNEKKVTGGRNGYGAKLTNVFSKKFIVETADKSVHKKFEQTYEKNMTVKHPPNVTNFSGQEFTKVTFWPDFARFGMSGFDRDIIGLMSKRVYDIAGSTDKRCKVILNGKQLPIRNFENYVDFYLSKAAGPEGPLPRIYERCNDRWEVAVSLTDGNFQQVSFVNSIATIKGGTHVNHVSEQLVGEILKVVKGKNRGGIDIKPAHVKNHLWVFVNCLIENPAFDSQTKETLTTKQAKFGSTCELSEKLVKQVMKSGVVEMILDWVRAKQKVDIARSLRSGTNKNTTRVLGVPKLEDANEAGGKNSHECTLILTEGDSAKALAVAGLSIVGRDRYGVFPLKGKLLNVRDANFKQVTGNTEIQNLLKIIGLDVKCEYNSTRGLRYGSIMIMTDQDHDGSHIKGLVINFVHHWWPSLVKMNGFLKEFVTPIVKVWKGGSKDGERKDERSFFTLNEYEKWKAATSSGGRGWKNKYYKGLGTSTAKEAKEYFRDIEHHELGFRWSGDHDGESIDLAFNKKRADDRKEWINGYEEGSHVDHTKRTLGYHDFVHKELVQFAKYDVSRSIPCVVDGFKPSQRKVLYSAFKKKLKNDIKVAQFVGYISEQAAYHHGEASLENTIVNLAQNFVGSNNTNLLVPSGQFGTRLQGGKDHAAARYIYTRLSPATRALFHPDDDPVLHYLEEEGQSIEPTWYCPILPSILLNGADGIGVGWSTFIPNYSPREIIRNIRKMLRGLPMEEMLPWYKGFKGSITPSEKEANKFDVNGRIEVKSNTTLEITELPVRKWTQEYKEFLEELMPGETKRGEEAPPHTIEDYREYHTENTVHFVLTLTPEKMREVQAAGLEKTFKTKGSISTNNMMLFDSDGKIAKYATSLDILLDFCKLRREVYEMRKSYLVSKLTMEREILSNKARFILMVVNGELELRKKKKADLLKELKQLRFTPMSELKAIMGKYKDKGASETSATAGAAGEDVNDDAAVANETSAEKTDYDYLLGMNLWSLTYEKVEEIKKLLEAKTKELDILKKTTIEQMWDRDLEALTVVLDELDVQEEEDAAAASKAADGRRRKNPGARGKAPLPAGTSAVSSGGTTKRRSAEDEKILAMPLKTGASATPVAAAQKSYFSSSSAEQKSSKAQHSAEGMPRAKEKSSRAKHTEPAADSTIPAQPMNLDEDADSDDAPLGDLQNPAPQIRRPQPQNNHDEPAKKRGRPPKAAAPQATASVATEPRCQPEPRQPEVPDSELSGSDLLARLLSRGNDEAPKRNDANPFLLPKVSDIPRANSSLATGVDETRARKVKAPVLGERAAAAVKPRRGATDSINLEFDEPKSIQIDDGPPPVNRHARAPSPDSGSILSSLLSNLPDPSYPGPSISSSASSRPTSDDGLGTGSLLRRRATERVYSRSRTASAAQEVDLRGPSDSAAAAAAAAVAALGNRPAPAAPPPPVAPSVSQPPAKRRRRKAVGDDDDSGDDFTL